MHKDDFFGDKSYFRMKYSPNASAVYGKTIFADCMLNTPLLDVNEVKLSFLTLCYDKIL